VETLHRVRARVCACVRGNECHPSIDSQTQGPLFPQLMVHYCYSQFGSRHKNRLQLIKVEIKEQQMRWILKTFILQVFEDDLMNYCMLEQKVEI
jgi:hypothetical protein